MKKSKFIEITAEKIKKVLSDEAIKYQESSGQLRPNYKKIIFKTLEKLNVFLLKSKIYREFYEKWILDLRNLFFSNSKVDALKIIEFEGEEFVRQGYLDILKREPDYEGLRVYLLKLQKGELRKIEFLGKIRFSEEGRKKGVAVKNLFLRYLFSRILNIPLLGLLFSMLYSPFIVYRILRETESIRFLLFDQVKQFMKEIHILQENVLKLSQKRINLSIPNDFYIKLEDKFRGEERDLEEKFSVYIPFINDLKLKEYNIKAIDIGCGRGEWLNFLRKMDIDGIGIEINSLAVDICRSKGLKVIKDDALSYLSRCQASSYDLVTAIHIFEHLPFEMFFAFFDEIKRVLKKGGLFIMETPNPTNILVSSYDFFLDPTHIKPIHPLSIKLLAKYKGFSDVEVYFVERKNGRYNLIEAESWKLDSIDDYIRVPRDFCLIARK